MVSRSEEKAGRRPYEKPALRKVELAAEEVLGGGCKLDHGPGPAVFPCTAGCNEQGT
jgi:hypothetical protein